MEVPDQNWFLNMVVEVATDLFPLQLLSRMGKIESRWGATEADPQRSAHHRHRYSSVMAMPWSRCRALEIPHPRFRDRRFVLAPLADLAPNLRDPVTRKTVVELLGELKGQTVRKFE